ncbi:hypothetical protein CBR_g39557 [Chara braunii]|uniref:Myb-like domain-containing protein n=1 Tax=Chara braunii TaxID=69332 RepID=A0A388LRY4_CHABU|nr:hypothetical protein CBR_g39557 [Chara braunii]|eukprot:GBG85096.1 hypothetical protein CBR_g39557 [Chara braunii]
MADVFRRLPLLLLVVLLLLLVVLFRVCILGNVPPRRRKTRSSMKDARMEARQAIPRSGGEQVGGRRCGGSLSTVGRASQRVGYDALPPHLQPLPGSSDEEEEVERRPQTVSLGSASTQEWTATELCGTGGGVYKESFTELLRPSLGEDEGDGRVNLSFGLSTRRSTTPSRTVLVRPHPGEEAGQLTVVDRSARTRALASETAGANRNSCHLPCLWRRKWREAVASESTAGPTSWMLVMVATGGRCGGTCDGITGCGERNTSHGGVERLHVGDRENEKETDDPPAEADDDNDDDDDNDVDCGEGGDGHASPSFQSDMAGKGGKSKPSGRNARPRAKKGQGKGSGGEGDGDAEEKRNFWSVEHIIALIRAKRDQDAHMQGMGHAYTRMKPREWKWQDVAQRLKNVGVDRNAEKCGKKWDNLMQQFKKVHHFQSPSGGADFFQLSSKERASKGFNFMMDRTVYDEIEGSTGMNHTIHPKNVADTGASGGVRPPSASYVDPESVADGEGGAGRENDEEGSTRGSSQTTGTPDGSGKRKSTRQQTFEALTECMEKHGELLASTMESASKRQCFIQVRQCEALEAEVEVQRKHYAASDEVNKLMCHALLEIAKVIRAFVGSTMSSRGGGRGKAALKQIVEGAAPAKKGRHQAKRQRKVVQAVPAGSARDVVEEAVVEEEITNDEDDFEDDDDETLQKKTRVSSAEGVRINEGGEGTPSARRGSGVAAANQPVFVDVARDVARRDVGGRTKEGAASHETAQRVLAPVNCPRTPAADMAGSSQAAVEGGTLRSPTVAARGGAVAVPGEAVEVPKGGDGVAAGEDDEALVHRLRGQRSATHAMDAAAKLWEDDNRFWNNTAVGTTKAMGGCRVSYERLKGMAEAMRYLLAATMWIMRMAGDDPRSHYDAWVFVQLTAKTTLLASMNRQFDAHRHITQSAQVMTNKLGRPPPTFAPPPVYIPDWASKCGVTFSHDATLASPMEAKRLDWLGTGPPEDAAAAAEGDDKGEGG